MIPILIIIAFCLGIWLANIARSGPSDDNSLRRKQLLKEALNQFPAVSLVEAVDFLYIRTLRQIIAKQEKGEDTEQLEDDLVILMSERTRILREYIQGELRREKALGI